MLKYYEPVLSEQGYTLLRRKAVPDYADTPARFPVLRESDALLGEDLPLPPGVPVWCEVELRETPAGKLRGFFYQELQLWIEVSQQEKVSRFRLVPKLCPAGFLLSPLLTTGDEALQWLNGQPYKPVTSVRFVLEHPDGSSFQPSFHYRFCRVPLDAMSAEPAAPATP